MNKHRKLYRILSAGGLLLGMAAISRAEAPLTWSDCGILAESNNPDLRVAHLGMEQSRSTASSVRSQLFPQVNASASAGISQTQSDPQRNNFSYGLSASQLLFDGFKTVRELDQAGWQIKADEYAEQLTQASVSMQLRQAFIEMLRSQQNILLAEKIAARRQQNQALVKLSYSSGREHRGSLMLAQAQAAQAQAAMNSAQRAGVLARFSLQEIIGMALANTVTVTGNLQPKTADLATPDFSDLLKQHPTVLSLALQTRKAESSYQNALAEFYPSLQAQAGLNRSGDDFPPATTNWSAGVSLSWPIFQGGKRLAEVSRAEAAWEQAKENERNGRAQLLTQLVTAWNNYADSVENAKIQEQFLSAAQERSKIAERQYSAGLLTFENWSLIEDDLVSTQKNWLNAQANAMKSEASWANAQGGIGIYE